MPEATPWPHFSAAELTCHCGCGRMEMDADFMSLLEMLRTAYGKPMTVTSGFRCPMHNLQASGTGLSGPHVTGKAVDLHVAGEDAFRLLAMAVSFGFTGIGVSQREPHNARFLHLDTIEKGPGRPRSTLWSY